MKLLAVLVSWLLLLAGCASPKTLDSSALTEPVGCQTGFRTRNQDLTVGLLVSFQTDPATGHVPGQTLFDIEKGDATGFVLFGENIFYQLCNDAVGVNDPSEEVDERWALVTGEIVTSIAVPEDDFESNGIGQVTATATGLWAEKPNGDRVEVGDFELVNSNWGFYGG